MKISIVIPVLNEEELLPKLIANIKEQDYDDYEIIVADGGSTDATVEKATALGARVVKGGKPAEGRNAGARAAEGDIIFFADADILLPAGFLKGALEEFISRNADAATCEFKPDNENNFDELIHSMANLFIKMNTKNDPHAPGFCIFVRKEIFEKTGGFDESLYLAEDHDFIKRAAAHGNFIFLNDVHIVVSVRRLDKEGRLNYIGKVIQVDLHRFFKGEVRDKIVEYEFASFDKREKSGFEKQFIKIKDGLQFLNEDYKKLLKRELKERSSEFQTKKTDIQRRFNNMAESLKELFERK